MSNILIDATIGDITKQGSVNLIDTSKGLWIVTGFLGENIKDINAIFTRRVGRAPEPTDVIHVVILTLPQTYENNSFPESDSANHKPATVTLIDSVASVNIYIPNGFVGAGLNTYYHIAESALTRKGGKATPFLYCRNSNVRIFIHENSSIRGGLGNAYYLVDNGYVLDGKDGNIAIDTDRVIECKVISNTLFDDTTYGVRGATILQHDNGSITPTELINRVKSESRITTLPSITAGNGLHNAIAQPFGLSLIMNLAKSPKETQPNIEDGINSNTVLSNNGYPYGAFKPRYSNEHHAEYSSSLDWTLVNFERIIYNTDIAHIKDTGRIHKYEFVRLVRDRVSVGSSIPSHRSGLKIDTSRVFRFNVPNNTPNYFNDPNISPLSFKMLDGSNTWRPVPTTRYTSTAVNDSTWLTDSVDPVVPIFENGRTPEKPIRLNGELVDVDRAIRVVPNLLPYGVD